MNCKRWLMVGTAGITCVGAQPVMAKDAIESRDEVIVVTASRGATPLQDVAADVTVRDFETLRRDGFTFGTDEFRGVPGVSFRRGEGDGDVFPFVSIRGSTGVEGYLTLVDGIPFDLNEEGSLQVVPYPALSRVEIVKGPVSTLYGGGALYGAVNYITIDPSADKIDVSLTAGSDDYYRGDLSVAKPLSDTLGLVAIASYENYGGWRENGGRENLNLFAKLSLAAGPDTDLTLYGSYQDQRAETPSVIPLLEDGTPVEVFGGWEADNTFLNPAVDLKGGIVALRAEHRFSDAFSMTATGQYRRFDFDNRLNFYDPFGFSPERGVFGVNGFYAQSKFEVAYGEVTAKYNSGRHDIVAGVTGQVGTVRRDDFWSGQYGFTFDCGFNFYLVEIDYVNGGVANRDAPCFVIDNPQASNDQRTTYLSAFVQDEVQLSDAFYLTLGARYDRFYRETEYFPIAGQTDGALGEARADAVSPKAALSWRYGDGQVYVAYGRGFNSNFGPAFEFNPDQYARPEQRPTTLDSVEIGWKGAALQDKLNFALTAFYSVQKNRRQTVPNPAAETDVTAPSSLITFGDRYESKGVEVALDFRPQDGTRLQLNYSHIAPEWDEYILQQSSGPLDLSGKTPVGVAENVVYVAGEQRITPWLSGRAIVEWYDDYQVTADNSVKGGSYTLVTLNARIAPQAWGGMSLDLTLLNALDEKYLYLFGGTTSPTYGTPGTPRQFRATLNASF